MELTKLAFEPKSTFISKIEYSYIPSNVKRSEIITVTFCDGSIIEYKPPIQFPPKEVFDFENFYNQFINSPSVGKFWHKEIKNRLEWKRIK